MKRYISIILMCFLLFSGCTKIDNNTKYISNKSKQKTNLSIDKNKEYNEINITKTISNPFFFNNNKIKLKYKGTFLFDDIIEKDINLNIKEIVNLKNGKLYELKLDFIEGVPSERLNLGYFYVQNDKIYKIIPNEENLSKLKEYEELPNESVIVCQDEEIKDTLGKDEIGIHQYLKVDGDKREYHLYNNKVETGYYEMFIWEKGKGLISYSSGYGAEKDSIELQLIENQK